MLSSDAAALRKGCEAVMDVIDGMVFATNQTGNAFGEGKSAKSEARTDSSASHTDATNVESVGGGSESGDAGDGADEGVVVAAGGAANGDDAVAASSDDTKEVEQIGSDHGVKENTSPTSGHRGEESPSAQTVPTADCAVAAEGSEQPQEQSTADDGEGTALGSEENKSAGTTQVPGPSPSVKLARVVASLQQHRSLQWDTHRLFKFQYTTDLKEKAKAR